MLYNEKQRKRVYRFDQYYFGNVLIMCKIFSFLLFVQNIYQMVSKGNRIERLISYRQQFKSLPAHSNSYLLNILIDSILQDVAFEHCSLDQIVIKTIIENAAEKNKALQLNQTKQNNDLTNVSIFCFKIERKKEKKKLPDNKRKKRVIMNNERLRLL